VSAPEVACPHCGETITDLWDHGWTYEDDETIETECGSCERPINLKKHTRTTYEVEASPPSSEDKP
jgi:predicted RNA-binding Zn-ribbon protein involved in translation (DUF1610 family)